MRMSLLFLFWDVYIPGLCYEFIWVLGLDIADFGAFSIGWRMVTFLGIGFSRGHVSSSMHMLVEYRIAQETHISEERFRYQPPKNRAQ